MEKNKEYEKKRRRGNSETDPRKINGRRKAKIIWDIGKKQRRKEKNVPRDPNANEVERKKNKKGIKQKLGNKNKQDKAK